MESIDIRKALISGGLNAASTMLMPSGSTALQQGIRGAVVSVGTDVIGGFAGYDSDNLIVTSAIAGGLNTAYGKWNNRGALGEGSGNMTRDFFMGALLHAAAGTVADSLEERGGFPGMIQHGINSV